MRGSLSAHIIKMTGPAISLQEILYGYIMALILTYATLFNIIEFNSIWDYGVAVIGMVLTWGVIDGIILYLLNVAEQRRYVREIYDFDGSHEEKVELLMDNLSGTPVDFLDDEGKRKVCESILDTPRVGDDRLHEERIGFAKISLGCVLITIGVLIPIIVPLFFIEDMTIALHAVSFISSAILFFVGYYMGPYLGVNRFICGIFIGGITLIIAFVSVFTGG